MPWATGYINRLQNGETVVCRPRGNSMTPKIKSGQQCIIEPITEPLRRGDIVLCQVGPSQYLHLISAIDASRDRYQISNNHGHINGWISRAGIFGKLKR